MNTKLAIIDEMPPHPLSGFRYQEFKSILKEIQGSTLYCLEEGAQLLGDQSADELIDNFYTLNPGLKNRVKIYNPNSIDKPDLLYSVFLGNTARNVLPLAEKLKTPFIFTLYPGSWFAIDDEISDEFLRSIFSSKYFKKVIVTQNISKQYIQKKFKVPNHKIDFIFGVVTPVEVLNNVVSRKYYGFEKKALDICFVAHKYTQFGEDKGYDIFVDVAKQLSKNNDNINFHVVGSFDKDVIDTSVIKNITFYGLRDQKWLSKFYSNIDIILSPNINGKIFKGSFDGFPTGTCTDASLRKVAMFVTDPLHLNTNYFIDSKEIVIIKHNTKDIINKINYYYHNPKKLKSISSDGCEKTKHLYGYDSQIVPRINLLKESLKEASQYQADSSVVQQKNKNNTSFIRKIYNKVKK